MVTLEL